MAEKERKTLLELVQNNLKNVHVSTYVTRFSYFGEYTQSAEELQTLMRSIIGPLRVDCGDNLVTGLLLVYPNFYIHLLEAPEDIIYMHFKEMYSNRNEDNKFGKAVLLPAYHHVYHTFFHDWFHVYTSAPSLLERIEKQTMEEVKKQVSSCFMKLYNLCDHISKAIDENVDEVEHILNNLNERFPEYLPESTILEYLLSAKSSVLTTAEDYLRIYSDVPVIHFYNDTIWPPPLENMPRYALEQFTDRKQDEDAKGEE